MAVNFGVRCCSEGVRIRIDEYNEVFAAAGLGPAQEKRYELAGRWTGVERGDLGARPMVHHTSRIGEGWRCILA